ncbi:uncharacterized protein MYCGRDRAFT_106622 [Zymoseptoria tritici IPO323]|uniref:Uncharacterized protein n=1 Tax=Zymoseptoria tritici (strain CBS 115943 / IPO323) TaxID=336722 RepID=F9XR05_ZYMTI|nr:uncharacterized protein MYCGRDRAFT_106622 [Zymoseptoria tritici IPO323]EGP82322.1 hypothetical protein MYCGRDRAFT_106622 [Zymoseptoria tritici IPO323]
MPNVLARHKTKAGTHTHTHTHTHGSPIEPVTTTCRSHPPTNAKRHNGPVMRFAIPSDHSRSGNEEGVDFTAELLDKADKADIEPMFGEEVQRLVEASPAKSGKLRADKVIP